MALSTQAWDRYWQNNRSLNSFAMDYSATDGPYGKINQFWQQVFAEFGPKTTVVDLGAGNGALAQLYLHSNPEPRIKQWLNIDSAKALDLQQHPVVKHQQDDMCNLSLSAQSVDHVVSMFGFEYADFALSLPQLYRCLRNGGTFHFILHHEDAIISQQSKITLEVFKQVLQSNLLAEMANFDRVEQLKSHLLQGLNQHLNSVKPEAKDDVKIIGQGIYNIMQMPGSLKRKVKELDILREDLHWQVERLQQQLKAAKQVQHLAKHLQQHHFNQYDLVPLKHNKQILGWSLTGTKVEK